MVTPSMSPFATHCLTVAAGCPVDTAAYAKHPHLNLAKLRALGQGFRQGWLHNVLGRITPLTVRDASDYTLMAQLFIATPGEALELMDKLSQDLTRFAFDAAINYHAPETARFQLLTPHLKMFNQIAATLCTRFNLAAPSPFTCITVTAKPAVAKSKKKTQNATEAEVIFIRDFLARRAA